MLRKKMYTWVFFQGFSIQGRKQITYVFNPTFPPPFPPFPPPAFLDHRFKIDLYIFIYAYIKKRRGVEFNQRLEGGGGQVTGEHRAHGGWGWGCR